MINFATKLCGTDGKPLPDDMARQSNGGIDVPLTLGHACSHALLASYMDEPTLAGDEKFKRASLALKVAEAGELALTVEEIAQLKAIIGRLYGAIVVYRAWCLLDPATAPASPAGKRRG